MSGVFDPMEVARAIFHEDGVAIMRNCLSDSVIDDCLAEIAAGDGLDWQNPATWPADRRLNSGVPYASVTRIMADHVVPAAAALCRCAPDDLAWPVGVNRIVAFPAADLDPATSPGLMSDWNPHVDGTAPTGSTRVADHLARFRVYVLVYLTDTPENGGGTVVWPGSHSRLLAHCEADPRTHEMMASLPPLIPDAIVDLLPVPTTPQRGDIVFFHPFCVHSGSLNESDICRVALRVSL